MRRPSLVLAGVAAATLALGACGSSSSSSAASASAGAPAASASGTLQGSITVFAAASLTEAFTTLGKNFQAAHPGTTVTFDFGASSALATQITQGAPADVFASASAKNMDQVVTAKAAANPTPFVKNVLEIAVPPGNPAN
ncbi:MAG TPA: molybdate ABC transporter substrate-binding protein, partial [Kineosporiaceae bacterium]|nr:molybdate ABC transporter substrate-binding protein [Kineosporiaceae bacterium]